MTITWNYPLPTTAQVEEAVRFFRSLPSETDKWFARHAPSPPAPEAHESLLLARRSGLRRPVALYGTALRFDRWFRIGKCDNPLSEGEILYSAGALTQSLGAIRSGRAKCELRLNHREDDALLTTDGGLDLRLSDDFNRVLVRLDADGDDAQLATATILAGDYTGWSLSNVPREFREVGYRKFIIDRADILEVSAVYRACCPGCPIRAEAAAAPRRPAPTPVVAEGPMKRILAAGGRGRVMASGESVLPSFRGVAYTGSPMTPAGFWNPVIIDLDGVKILSQTTPVLKQHNPMSILGHTTAVKVTKGASGGIFTEGVFSGQSKEADKVVVPARNGFPWMLSVGADPVRTERLDAGEEETVNGRRIKGPMMISRETILGEISFVPLGADRDTSVDVTAKRRESFAPSR